MAYSPNGDFGGISMQKEDCVFFVECGTCSYGKNCKFNHPPREDSHVLQEGSAEIVDANYTRRISCKYFHSGFCKYGSYCGFNHSIPAPPLPTNSDGLPMRLGEPECSHYTTYRWCGYGARCKFNHLELNNIVPQEDGSHTFGQDHDELLETTDGEVMANNE